MNTVARGVWQRLVHAQGPAPLTAQEWHVISAGDEIPHFGLNTVYA